MNLTKHKFLITGSTGFVGSLLLRTLLSHKASVDIIIRKHSKLWRIKDLLDDVNIYYSDLSSLPKLKKIIQKSNPSIIYHLATNGAYSIQNNPNTIIQTNILGTWNLLQATKDINYQLFVNTGSSSEYGFKKSPMKETDLVEPASYYAVTKCSQTLLCSHVAKQHTKPIVTFRLFSVYGPFEEPARLVPTLMLSLKNGKKMKLVSPSIARDYIFVNDVISAYLKIDKLIKTPGECFNIGTGVQTTLKEIVSKSILISGQTIDLAWGEMGQREWDTDTWVGDISKAKRLLDWKAKNSLESGLDKTWKWFQSHNHKEYYEKS
ncbi:MAG: NAD-dependent epimerase/dehydratase family protein [Candidatus Pacebacteria bacterium]|jgi:nucleoside-diphosphate-sugar epimerase|nr:NAD-dependent epimerase/dehydratase family protein [Candidatus Paceibacterota bacterium]